MTIDRILNIIDYYGLTKSSIERELGFANGYLAKMSTRKGDVGVSVVQKIFSRFPEISLIWLITGTGDMISLQKQNTPGLNVVNEPPASNYGKQYLDECKDCAWRERLLEAKEETIKSLREQIKMLTK
jgi:hypothetical protein